jgi:hypothetical protein
MAAETAREQCELDKKWPQAVNNQPENITKHKRSNPSISNARAKKTTAPKDRRAQNKQNTQKQQ